MQVRPPLVELMRLVTTGALGTMLQVEANNSHTMLAHVDAGHWRAQAAESPGAGLTGIGSHVIDAYTDIFRTVEEVRALSALVRSSAAIPASKRMAVDNLARMASSRTPGIMRATVQARHRGTTVIADRLAVNWTHDNRYSGNGRTP